MVPSIGPISDGSALIRKQCAGVASDVPPAAPLKKDLVMLRYISSPAVSHRCSFTSRPLTDTVCDVKAAPMVGA